MDRRYKYLDAEERGVILAANRRKSSPRQIGRLAGRHHGTIGLELKRGTTPCGIDPRVACDLCRPRHNSHYADPRIMPM